MINLFLFITLIALGFTQNLTHSAFASSNQQINEAHFQNEILNLINQYRSSKNLNPLMLHPIISKEAHLHSADMAKHELPFGHDRFTERVKRIYAYFPNARGAAENVAYNYKNPADVVRNWLKSPGHLANIRGHYQWTGIGIALDENGKIYYTQIFLREAENDGSKRFFRAN